jgi:hypothetical protein
MLTVNVTPAPLLSRSRTAREAIQSALLAKPENTADIQAKATTLGNAQSAMTVQQRALREAKINEVFMPAQITILDTSRKELRQRGRHVLKTKSRYRIKNKPTMLLAMKL